MEYKKIYNQLIQKRLENELPQDVYGEVHHIIPKSEGGSNDKSNLVRLSAREHYIAHLLLAHIYNDQKMWCALNRLVYGNKKNYTRVTSRMYEVLRRELSIKVSERMSGDKSPNYGRTPWNKGLPAWNRDKHPEEETRKKMSESHKGLFTGELKNRMIEHQPRRVSILQYTPNGEFVNMFVSIRSVERELGFQPTHISQCCLGKRKTAYGYVWKRATSK